MEAVCFFKTLPSTDEFTRRQNLQENRQFIELINSNTVTVGYFMGFVIFIYLKQFNDNVKANWMASLHPKTFYPVPTNFL